MGLTAQLGGGRRNLGGGRGADGRQLLQARHHQPPQTVDIAPGAVHTGLGPVQVPLGRAVGQHEQTRRVGPVGIDDAGRVDDVFLGLAHLFRAAKGHRAAALAVHQAAVVAAGHLFRVYPGAVGVLVGLVADHALGQQAGERFLDPQIAAGLQGPGEETGIQKVQHRMLDAADILVHRQPAVGGGPVKAAVGDLRRAETGEIPGRLEKGVEGVGFPPRRGAASRTGDMLPGGMMGQGIARFVEGDVLGQGDRQIVRRHRYHAAGLAMNDGDRTAPIALARHAPVAQPVIHRAAAQPLGFHAVDDPAFGVSHRHAVQRAGIDHHPVIEKGLGADADAGRVDTFGGHHRGDRQAVFAGEVEIPLVMAGAAENGAGAIVHEDEIGHVNRQFLAVHQGIDGLQAGVAAAFLGGFQGRLAGTQAVAVGDEGGQRRVLGGQLEGQRMIGGDGTKGRAVQGVRPRGVNVQAIGAARQREGDAQPFGTADPVFLHQAHPVGPALQLGQSGQQVLGEGGDLEEPLVQQALFHQGAGSPAAAIDDLFIGQHGVFHGVPVDPGFLAVDQPVVQEVEEHLLFMAIIFGVAGGDFPGPVIGHPHGLELGAHGGDVFAGPLGRRHLVLDGGVFRRQSEGIPSHGMQHGMPGRPLVAGDHVT